MTAKLIGISVLVVLMLLVLAWSRRNRSRRTFSERREKADDRSWGADFGAPFVPPEDKGDGGSDGNGSR